MTVALIDADVIVYRAASVGQEDIDWGDGQEGPTVNTPKAIRKARDLVTEWSRAARSKAILLCFSDRLNFRKAVHPEYKANRKHKVRPSAFDAVTQMLEAENKHFRIPCLEADDVMGILATSPRFTNAVIVSIDKDLQSIPGKLVNPDKDKRPRRISEFEADRFWMYQTLTGDSTDNYKGCPKIGPVKAGRILEGKTGLAAMWAAVVETFIEAGLTEDDALVQARLARILRREDYDRDKERIRLWHPNPKKFEFLTRAQVTTAIQLIQTTTDDTPSSPSNTSSKTGLATASGTSSSTSRATRTKGGRSKTSKRQGATSIG